MNITRHSSPGRRTASFNPLVTQLSPVQTITPLSSTRIHNTIQHAAPVIALPTPQIATVPLHQPPIQKTETRINYVPQKRQVTRMIDQEVEEIVPKEKTIVEYIPVQTIIEKIPQPVEVPYEVKVPVPVQVPFYVYSNGSTQKIEGYDFNPTAAPSQFSNIYSQGAPQGQFFDRGYPSYGAGLYDLNSQFVNPATNYFGFPGQSANPFYHQQLPQSYGQMMVSQDPYQQYLFSSSQQPQITQTIAQQIPNYAVPAANQPLNQNLNQTHHNYVPQESQQMQANINAQPQVAAQQQHNQAQAIVPNIQQPIHQAALQPSINIIPPQQDFSHLYRNQQGSPNPWGYQSGPQVVHQSVPQGGHYHNRPPILPYQLPRDSDNETDSDDDSDLESGNPTGNYWKDFANQSGKNKGSESWGSSTRQAPQSLNPYEQQRNFGRLRNGNQQTPSQQSSSGNQRLARDKYFNYDQRY